MAVRVLCSNPNCGASFSVDPANLGKGQRCRKCGWPLNAEAVPSETEPFVGRVPVPPPDPAIDLPNPFAGRYKLIKVLGKGGMGAVYLARDTKLKRQVALKVPLISGDEDPDFLKRFQREACALAQFHHPNICPIHDVGDQDGQPYLVMAFIEGTSLAAHLKQRKLPFEPAEVARLVRILALALQEAHDLGIVHRDLKPGNIMIGREGGPVIMDFGVARRNDPEESLRTRAGETLGTLAYMPLEQCRGEVDRIGPGCDIYSLGVILYQLLTGRLPYEGPPALMLAKLLTSEPPPPSSHRPGLDPELEAICLKAMARRIEDRYSSMTEFAEALRGYLDKVPGTSRSGSPTAVVDTRPDRTEDRAKAAVVRAERDSQRTLPDHREPIASDSLQPQATPALDIDPIVGTRAGEERDDNGLKMKFCWCPPGSFQMGSPPTEPERDNDEGPVHVTLSRGFWVGKYEVTQEQWHRTMGTTIREQARKTGIDTTYGESPSHPVYCVSADEADEFCRRLTESERGAGRLPAGWSYKLPTEAQWEYACRAETTTATAFGDRLGSQDANFDGNYPYNGAPKGPYLKGTAAVGSYRSNAWGLYDMHGNVWEWCQDGYEERLPGGVDPVGPLQASARVLRGGCWVSDGWRCRSASRSRVEPDYRDLGYGFRLAAVLSRS